jgi:hypothetical protein
MLLRFGTMPLRVSLVVSVLGLSACTALPEVDVDRRDAGPSSDGGAFDAAFDGGPNDLGAGDLGPDLGPDMGSPWTHAIVSSIPLDLSPPASTSSNEGANVECTGTFDYAGTNTAIHTLSFARSDEAIPFSVHLYPNSAAQRAGNCMGTCRSLGFAESGSNVTTVPANTLFSYLLIPAEDNTTSVLTQWAGQRTDPESMGTIHSFSVSPIAQTDFETTRGSFGHAGVPGTANMLTITVDCLATAGVANLAARFIREDGSPLGHSGRDEDTWNDVVYPSTLFGPGTTLPDRTSGIGFITAGNIPIADVTEGELYRVELWGRDSEGNPLLASCDEVRLFADSMTYYIAPPLHTRSPASCTSL